jgi:Protein of unknown function (DUF3078)
MKKIVLTVFAFLLAFVSYAQEPKKDTTKKDSVIIIPKKWQKTANVAFNFSNVQLSNWVGGGQSSLSITSLVGLAANYSKGKSSWKNSLDVSYGQARLGGKDASFRKTDDQLIIQSAFAQKLKNELWAFSASALFRTQLDLGYKYETINNVENKTLISQFMSPGYLNTAIGFSYIKPNYTFTVSPLSSKFTFVGRKELSDSGAYGVDRGKQVRTELLGISVGVTANYKIAQNVQWKTNFLAFANYNQLEVWDIFWENQFLFKVNKFINATFTTQMIYDQDVTVTRDDGTQGPDLQYKQVLNIGFLYSIKSK